MRPTFPLLLFLTICFACAESNDSLPPARLTVDASELTDSLAGIDLIKLGVPSADELSDRATHLIDLGLESGGAWELLKELCTLAPKRLAGSPGFEKAVDWGVSAMQEIGLQNIAREPVMVPRWVRGEREELSFQLADGTTLSVPVTALGGSIETGPGGITAAIVECDGLAGVAAAGEKLRGKIAFLSQPMRATARTTGQAYGEAVPQRTGGAAAAAKFGAVAVLVRSMSTAQDDKPHTGAMHYEVGGDKIPAAAIGVLSAEKLSADLKKGIVYATLELDCVTLPDIEQWNVIGEIVGTDLRDEIIVVGGHLDAWGTGVGAHDDGAGCAQSLESARLILESGIRPRRTIRVVLFANEENGLAGAKGYAKRHSKTEKHFLAMETDSGAFGPRGIGLSKPQDVIDRLQGLGKPLGQVGAERLFRGGGGADIGPLRKDGCIQSSLKVNDERYFDVHHSANDTLEFVNPREIELGAVVMAYWLTIFANMDPQALESTVAKESK